MHSYSRQHLVHTTEACYSEISELSERLTEEQWQVQSLCPSWSVRQAIAHTVGVEDALGGWEPSATEHAPFGKADALTATSASMSANEFRDRVKEIFEVRRGELAGLRDDDLDREALTPVGLQTYGRFLAIRIFDMWVHVRDCSIPLGRATVDTGSAAEITLDEIERSIGFIIGKRVGLPNGMTLRVDVTGSMKRSITVTVDGRARAVDPASVPQPDVVLAADSTTFIMLACGRIDPQPGIDNGSISWSGDSYWGEHAARHLRFTM